MNRHTLSASILLTAASLFAGCDAAPPEAPPSDFRASPTLDDEVADACANFEARMSGAYALPKAPGTPKLSSYAKLLETYLLAAADQDEAATAASLEAIHAVLRGASAREFVMFSRALSGSVLAGAVDAKGGPILRPIDVAALPLVLLLHDMGARNVDSDLANWLFLRRDAVSVAWSKPSPFSTAGVFIDHGEGLLRMSVSDQAKVIDAITAGTFLRGCGLDELQTPLGDVPLCPAECEFEVAKLGLNDSDAAALQSWCDVMGGELLPELNPGTADVMLACLDAYEGALGRSDLSVCLVESFASLSDDPFPSYEGRTNVRLAQECTLSTSDQEDAAQAAGTDAATGQDPEAALAELVERRRILEESVNNLEDLVNEDPSRKAIREAELRPIIDRQEDEIHEIDKEIGTLENGDTGSKRCAFDSQSCTSSCGIQNAVQQATEACLQSTSKKDAMRSPEPIDPPQPIVDPDSPIGVLTSCLAEAALADDDTGTCGTNFNCPDGKPTEEVDGLCICEGERSAAAPQWGCDETIQCIESPCTCEGEPMTDAGGAPPRPDPFLLLTYRG